HPAVRECAVLAVQLPDARTVLKAFVVMKDQWFEAQAATRELQDYVKRKLVPYKYPRLVEFLTELPKTGTGKIDRQALLAGAALESPPLQEQLPMDPDRELTAAS